MDKLLEIITKLLYNYITTGTSVPLLFLRRKAFMQKSFARRTLLALVLVAMLVCALCVTVMAENVSYDFSVYGNTAKS